MVVQARESLEVTPGYEWVFRAPGLTAEGVFGDPRIVVWRSITERQNCTVDLADETGRPRRLHVKRYWPAGGGALPAADEARGIRALQGAGLATVPLAAVGELADGRSFVITEDLTGFRPADKLIAGGVAFESLLGPTAEMAARLHNAGLHHRDLYLCHFFVRADADGAPAEMRLIDAARVRALPGFLTRRRWIVKDLAQFWYSTESLAVSEEQRERWLVRYSEMREGRFREGLVGAVRRKARAIARHDARLKVSQPKRNVSLA